MHNLAWHLLQTHITKCVQWRWFEHLLKNVPQVSVRSVPSMANWEKARGPTQNTLQGLQPSCQGIAWASRRKSCRKLLKDGSTLYSYSSTTDSVYSSWKYSIYSCVNSFVTHFQVRMDMYCICEVLLSTG